MKPTFKIIGVDAAETESLQRALSCIFMFGWDREKDGRWGKRKGVLYGYERPREAFLVWRTKTQVVCERVES